MAASERIGQGVADTAASNVSLAGSPANALADERWLSEEDAATLQASGGRQAWSDVIQGNNFEKEGKFAKENADSQSFADLAGGIIGGASSVLGYAKGGGWLSPGGDAIAAGSGITITPEMVEAPKLAEAY